MPADCKSVSTGIAGSNPAPSNLFTWDIDENKS